MQKAQQSIAPPSLPFPEAQWSGTILRMIQVNHKHEPLSTTPLVVSEEKGCNVFTFSVQGSGGQRGVDGKFVKWQGADLTSEPSH